MSYRLSVFESDFQDDPEAEEIAGCDSDREPLRLPVGTLCSCN
jgi:hypothetical protein